MPASFTPAGPAKKKKGWSVGRVVGDALNIVGAPQRVVGNAILSPVRELSQLLQPDRFVVDGVQQKASLSEAFGFSGTEKSGLGAIRDETTAAGKPLFGGNKAVNLLADLGYGVFSDPLGGVAHIGVGLTQAPRALRTAELLASAGQTAERAQTSSALAQSLARLGVTAGEGYQGGRKGALLAEEILGRGRQSSAAGAEILTTTAANLSAETKAALGYSSRITWGAGGARFGIPGTERLGEAISKTAGLVKEPWVRKVGERRLAAEAVFGATNKASRIREIGRSGPYLAAQALKEEAHPGSVATGLFAVGQKRLSQGLKAAAAANAARAFEDSLGTKASRALYKEADFGAALLADPLSPASQALAESRSRVLDALRHGAQDVKTGEVRGAISEENVAQFATTWDNAVTEWSLTPDKSRLKGQTLHHLVESLGAKAGEVTAHAAVADNLAVASAVSGSVISGLNLPIVEDFIRTEATKAQNLEKVLKTTETASESFLKRASAGSEALVKRANEIDGVVQRMVDGGANEINAKVSSGLESLGLGELADPLVGIDAPAMQARLGEIARDATGNAAARSLTAQRLTNAQTTASILQDIAKASASGAQAIPRADAVAMDVFRGLARRTKQVATTSRQNAAAWADGLRGVEAEAARLESFGAGATSLPLATEHQALALELLGRQHPDFEKFGGKFVKTAAAEGKQVSFADLTAAIKSRGETLAATSGQKQAAALEAHAKLQSALLGDRAKDATAKALAKSHENFIGKATGQVSKLTDQASALEQQSRTLTHEQSLLRTQVAEYQSSIQKLSTAATAAVAGREAEQAAAMAALHDTASHVATQAQFSVKAHRMQLLSQLNDMGVPFLTLPDADKLYVETFTALSDMGLKKFGDSFMAHPDFVNYLKDAESVTKEFSQVTKLWRAFAVLRPGFSNRNFIGAFVNNLASGVKLADYREAAQFIAALKKGGSIGEGEAARGFTQAWEMMAKNGQLADLTESFKFLHGFAERGGSFMDEKSVVKMFATGGFGQGGARSVGWGVHSIVNVEENVRMAQFLRLQKEGYGFERAVEQVYATHFDYSDLSNFDRSVRQFVPFWTYRSRNLPMQAQLYLHAPALTRNLLIQREHLRTSNGTDMSKLPPWMDGLAMPMGMSVLDLNNYLPGADIVQLADNLSQLNQGPGALTGVAAGLLGGPGVAVGEVLANKQLFSGRPVFRSTDSPLAQYGSVGHFLLGKTGFVGDAAITTPRLIAQLFPGGQPAGEGGALANQGVFVKFASNTLGVTPKFKTYGPPKKKKASR